MTEPRFEAQPLDPVNPDNKEWQVIDTVSGLPITATIWRLKALLLAGLLCWDWPTAMEHGRCPLQHAEPCWDVVQAEGGASLADVDIAALAVCSEGLTRLADCFFRVWLGGLEWRWYVSDTGNLYISSRGRGYVRAGS
jgi:hypothetical protein